MKPVPVITVDGPSGSGKGTIAAAVARIMGFHLLDSGALYRILGCVALDRQLDLEDHQRLAQLAHDLDIRFGGRGSACVTVDDQDYTQRIREEIGGEMASRVGAIPAVRAALFQRQLAFRQLPGLVADGRDMGTVVFPDALLKIFLTATPEERARRRYNQLIAKGSGANLPTLLQELKERDARDSSRAVSPLRPAGDAHILDTTNLSIDEVVSKVLELVRETGI